MSTRPVHRYSEEALNAAIIDDGMPIRTASVTFGVPRATLQDRIHGRIAAKPRKMEFIYDICQY